LGNATRTAINVLGISTLWESSKRFDSPNQSYFQEYTIKEYLDIILRNDPRLNNLFMPIKQYFMIGSKDYNILLSRVYTLIEPYHRVLIYKYALKNYLGYEIATKKSDTSDDVLGISNIFFYTPRILRGCNFTFIQMYIKKPENQSYRYISLYTSYISNLFPVYTSIFIFVNIGKISILHDTI
jgi:hypothetical protein